MGKKQIGADILVCGAGPAGLTAAALLGRAGFTVVLLDPDPAPPPGSPPVTGRTAALLTGSLNILKTLGVWDDIKGYAAPLKTMTIIDEGGENSRAVFRATDIGLEYFGFNVPNARLRTALTHLISTSPTVTHRQGAGLEGYEVNGMGITARATDGKIIRASLIIGTDGRQSRVRQVAGIKTATHDYGQTAITCVIGHSRPHGDTSTEFHRAGGPFTLVPLPGNVSSVVWVEKTARAHDILSFRRNDFEQALQAQTNGILGKITLLSAPESWPLALLRAKSLTAPRAAIAAEAAHVLSPIGAQGLNLSFRDIAALSETLTDAARRGEDIGAESVLARYAQRRERDIQTRVRGIDTLNRAVVSEFSLVAGLRRLGLRGLQNVAPLRRFAMRSGLAPGMEDSRLLRGERL